MIHAELLKRFIGQKGKGFWSNLMPIYDFVLNPKGSDTIVEIGEDYVVVEERYFRQVIPLSRFRFTIPKG